MELPPTNISATDKFITKYMERVRRLLFFTKRIIDRRFTAITATVIVRDTAYHVLHSAEEILLEIIFFLLILFSPPFRKKSNKVWLVEKRKLIRRWTKRTEVDSLNIKNGDCTLTTILQ